RAEAFLTLLVLDVTDWTAGEATERSISRHTPACNISRMLKWPASFRLACPEPACRRFLVSLKDRFAGWLATCDRSKVELGDAPFLAMQNVAEISSSVRANVQVAT